MTLTAICNLPVGGIALQAANLSTIYLVKIFKWFHFYKNILTQLKKIKKRRLAKGVFSLLLIENYEFMKLFLQINTQSLQGTSG